MMKELKSDEPYEVAPGCPTISFDLGGESLMLAYSSFASGNFKGGRIELIFQEWRVEIEGANLEEVWKMLQMQDLRVLHISLETSDRQNGACRICRITVERIPEK